ncbi:MAG: HIT domain-containing protein [Burkholderiales bacterium]
MELHPRLQADCIVLGAFPLCRVLLMNDANYPWFILVPQRENIVEIHQLSGADQVRLIRESAYLSRELARCFAADKMNVAALGNVVSQLHVHHIVRYRDDPAWPAPVWGKLPARPYVEGEITIVVGKLQPILHGAAQYLA